MNNAQQELPSLSEQAATWFLRMQEGNCSDAERKAFWSWLTDHPDHYKEYQQYIQLWNQLDQLNPGASQPKRKPYRIGIAVVLMATMLGMMQWSINREETISTALGQRQHLVLADGTEVDMNGATVLRVTMHGYTRKVTLEQGEALFNVAHSALRPFEVHAGNGTLRDIGTSFNVAREEEKTTVAVLEGIVQVSLDNSDRPAAITLHGGEQITYTKHGHSAVSATDAKAATAWREGRIIFKETSLPEAIHQINRYHARQIVLVNPELNDLKVSGEFNTADREGLIRALKILFPLSSEERAEVTTLALIPKGAISR